MSAFDFDSLFGSLDRTSMALIGGCFFPVADVAFAYADAVDDTRCYITMKTGGAVHCRATVKQVWDHIIIKPKAGEAMEEE